VTLGRAFFTSVDPVTLDATARRTRARYVALLVLGCALAAAAAGTGPYLVADRNPPPFRLRLARPRFRIEHHHKDSALRSALRHYGAWLDVALQVVVLLVGAAVVAVGVWQAVKLLRRLMRLRFERSSGLRHGDAYDAGDGTGDDAETALRHRVADELAALSAELDTGADAREAVIACYVRMERALADAGSPRHPTESPLELLDRVLGEQAVPAADATRLTELFSEARFSTHPVTDEMRDAARRSLAAVADALTAGAPA
jgi:hypothetical protein